MQNRLTHKSTRERVIEILADKLVRSPDEIENHHTLKDDLGIDSLDFVEILVELEDEFDREFDEGQSYACWRVHDLIVLCGGEGANVLGLRCPECGNDQNLVIEGRALFTLRGDSFEDPGEIELRDEGYVACPVCDWEGEYQELKPRS